MFFRKVKKHNKLFNHSIGLIIENSSNPDDIRIYYGKILKKDDDSYYFTDELEKINLSLDEDDLKNAKKVTSEIKRNNEKLKDCDYTIWIKVNLIDIDKPTDDMIKTNINWK